MKWKITETPEGEPIDFDFRPQPYDAVEHTLAGTLSGIQGQARRELAQMRLKEGFADVEEARFVLKEKLSDDERRHWGRIHPVLMGGEFLPEFSDAEIEIARISMASTTGDVISIRSKRTPNGWRHRAVDEYEDSQSERELLDEDDENYCDDCDDFADSNIKLSPRESKQPLSMGELIKLIDGARDERWEPSLGRHGAEWRGLVIPYLEYQLSMEDGELLYPSSRWDMEDLEYFLTVSSPFYPQLSGYYEQVVCRWVDARLAEFFPGQDEDGEEEDWF